MNIKYNVDQRLKAIYDEGARQNNPNQNKRRLPHGLAPNDLDMARAIAMVRVALDKNEKVRSLWVDIRCSWDKKGCAGFAVSFFENDTVLSQWFDTKLKGKKCEPIPDADAFELMAQSYQGWQHPDMVSQINLVDNFIVLAFNGPIEPAIQHRWVHKARPVPKFSVRVTSRTAPLLKLAVILLSLTDHKGIDFEDIDREQMGANYELVTSGKKPSSEHDRKQKPAVNNQIRNVLKMSFIQEGTIRKGAEMWYQAYVIRGSIVDTASDYCINNPSTCSRMIEPYKRIAESG